MGCPRQSQSWRVASIVMLLSAVAQSVRGDGPLYVPNNSVTSFVSDDSFEISYVDQDFFSGVIVADIIQIGKFFAKCRFGAAFPGESHFTSSYDGILGLGMGGLALDNAAPVFYSLSDPKAGKNRYFNVVNSPVFTLILYNDELDGPNVPRDGEVQLGGYDNRTLSQEFLLNHDNDVLWQNVVPMANGNFGFYSVEIEGIAVGGHTVYDDKAVGMLDSGSENIILPTDYNGVNICKRFMETRITRGNTTIEFVIGGVSFAIPNELKRVQACSTTPSAMFILGDPFFRHIAVVHDIRNIEQPRLGFCPHNMTSATPPSAPAAEGQTDGLPRRLSTNDESNNSRDGPHYNNMGLWVERVGMKALTASDEGYSSNGNIGSNRYGRRLSSASAQKHCNDRTDCPYVTSSGRRREYAVNVTIGTPRSGPFTLIIDTGSSLTVVLSENVDTDLFLVNTVITISGVLILAVAMAFYLMKYYERRYQKSIESLKNLSGQPPEGAQASGVQASGSALSDPLLPK